MQRGAELREGSLSFGLTDIEQAVLGGGCGGEPAAAFKQRDGFALRALRQGAHGKRSVRPLPGMRFFIERSKAQADLSPIGVERRESAFFDGGVVCRSARALQKLF